MEGEVTSTDRPEESVTHAKALEHRDRMPVSRAADIRNKTLLGRLERGRWCYSISIRCQKSVTAAIAAIPESAWQTIEDYPPVRAPSGRSIRSLAFHTVRPAPRMGVV